MSVAKSGESSSIAYASYSGSHKYRLDLDVQGVE